MFTSPRLKKLVNLEVVLWIALAVWQVIFRVFTFYADYDHVVQMGAGLNLLDGHGLGQFSVAVGDLAKPVPALMSQWPPGFAIIFDALFLLLGNTYAAMLMADVAAVLLYLGGGAFLCWRFRDALRPDARVVFALVIGLLGFPIYQQTNLLAVALMIIGVGLLIPPLGRTEASGLSIAFSGALFSSLVSVRYAYVLVSFAPVPVFLWEAQRDTAALRRAKLFLSGWAVPILAFLWWKHFYVQGFGPGFLFSQGMSLQNLKNVLWTCPFGSDALTAHRFSNLFPDFSFFSAPGFSLPMFIVRHILSASLIWVAVVGALASIRDPAEPSRIAARRRFFLIGAVVSVCTAGVLFALTSVHPALVVSKLTPYPVGRMVWVEQSRYWLPLGPFILMGIMLAFSREPKNTSQRRAGMLARVSLLAATALWAVVLPREIQHFKSGHVGGPIQDYYANCVQFHGFLMKSARTDMLNVVALCGGPSEGTYLREAQATIAGWASVKVKQDAVIRTSQAVNLVAFLEPAADAADVRTYQAICALLNGQQKEVDGNPTCRGTFAP